VLLQVDSKVTTDIPLNPTSLAEEVAVEDGVF